MADKRESLAWDRFGRFLGDSASTASTIAKRNQQVWSEISVNLRKGDDYTANEMAGDLARSLVAAVDTLDDLWSVFWRNTSDQRVAGSIPTVFMLFQAAGSKVHNVPEHAPIEVDSKYKYEDLPPTAEIRLDFAPAKSELEGAAKMPGQYSDAVKSLSRRLRARRSDDSPSYILEATNPDGPDPDGPSKLVPGIYYGLVYLPERIIALADLRIVVEALDQ